MIINHCMTLRNPEEFILCKIVSFKRYAVGALGDNIENLGEHLNKTTRSFDFGSYSYMKGFYISFT